MSILHHAAAAFDPKDCASVRAYLRELLSSPDMNDSCSRKYERGIVRFIENNAWTFESVSGTLKTICAEVKTDRGNHRISYAAFYALCTYCRKNSHLTEYRSLLNEYDNYFKKEETSFQFLELMYRSASASQTPREINRKLLTDAEELCCLVGLKHNYGVAHLFAEIVAIYFESFLQKDLSSKDLSYIDTGIDYVTRALEESKSDTADRGYPKFYMTRARLLYLKAIFDDSDSGGISFDKAHEDVAQAIDYEENAQKMAAYQLKESSLRSAYYEESLRRQVNKLEHTFRELDSASTKKNLELLSFFAAIFSLIVTGMSLATKIDFPHSAILLLIMTGCISVAFGGFGFVINNKERKLANIILILIGSLLIIGAILYGGAVC